ncbi:MAG: hypothetical protein L3J43_11740 [Sulfurovum sp.]|nr:hypothetical protein [Sulfurovum sp.]
MDYLSIVVSAILGGVGAGLGHIIMSKFTKNKNIVRGVSVIMAILFYQILQPIIYDKYIKPSFMKPKIYTELVKHIDDMNRQLPKMMDSATKLESISVHNEQLFYNYMIVQEDIKDTDIKKMEQSIKKNSCNRPFIKNLINNNISVIYSYSFVSKPYKMVIKVTDCKQ